MEASPPSGATHTTCCHPQSPLFADPAAGVTIIFVQRFRSIPLTVLISALLLFALGCGQFFPGGTTITALQVLPANSSVAPGVAQQYTATATYGNNSTGDVTSQVTWSVNPSTYATITSGGLLTGVTLGTATVQAASGSVIGSTSVTVTNLTVTSVAIQPLTQTLSVSGGANGPSSVQFTATATYQNGSTGNVTSTATWNAIGTPSGAATITSSGVCTAESVGTATVTATAGGVTSNSATVTIVQ